MEKMITAEIRNQLINAFKGLKEPVSLLFFGSKLRACEYCEQTWQLLSELIELSDKLTLKSFDIDENPGAAAEYHVELVPGIVITANEGNHVVDYGMRFAGIPAGHEFSSIIRTILMVSRRDSGLSKQSRAFLKGLKKPIRIQVFVTTTCGYCPAAVILAQQFAMESPMVQAEMIEAVEFDQLASKYHVSGVPHTVINDGAGEVIGVVPEDLLIEEVKKVI